MNRLLLVLLGSSQLLAKQQFSFVHAFSSSIAPPAVARTHLVGTAATRRRRWSLTPVTMISIHNNNEGENELFASRRDVIRTATAAAAAAITTALTTTTYAPLPAMAAASASGSGGGVIIVVAGATGQTGRRILERLSKKATGSGVLSVAVIGGVRGDITKAQKSLNESSTIIRGAMIQQVNSIDTTTTTTNGGGGGEGRLELKHLDVVKDTTEELIATLSGASALVIATGFVPGNPLKMNVAAHEVDNVGTCKLIVSSTHKHYIH